MRTTEEIEQLKSVKEKLKECKPEWLEKNAKGQNSLGVLTVQQILDYATDAVTSWNFSVEEQWREEVNKFDKRSGSWLFDGYVYHVRGTLHIEGLGSRSQYGSKVAIGGKDNQNSSYKSAASDCLKKCASLFGVGSSIYSKIKIETEEEQWTNNNQQNAYNQQQEQNQQQQIEQPQQVTLPNGDVQQGEWIWSHQANNWIHQSQYQSQQGGQYPRQLTPEQEKAQWYDNTMKEFDPKGYQQMQQEQGMSALAQEHQQIQEAMNYANQQANNPNTEFPFEASANQQAQQQNYQAQPMNEAVPQGEAKQQDFQAIQYGAPVETKEEPKESVEQKDPLAHVVADNPWNTPEVQQEINTFAEHKKRLGIENDSQLLPHVREYFKDASATIASVTPDTLKGFNAHLQNIQA